MTSLERIAIVCRQAILTRFGKRSCVESGALVSRVLHGLGVPHRMAVCEAQAFNRVMADALRAGAPIEEIARMRGGWSVLVGAPSEADDFPGRQDRKKNRFVGHVVVFAEANGTTVLIDPSADQMDRPGHGLRISGPLCCPVPANEKVLHIGSGSGMVVYRLREGAFPPDPVRSRIIGRLAARLLGELKDTARNPG